MSDLRSDHSEECAWTRNKSGCTCGYRHYVSAIDVVAEHIVWNLSQRVEDMIDREDYPELSERVWNDVIKSVTDYFEIDQQEFETAYQRLAALETEQFEKFAGRTRPQ